MVYNSNRFQSEINMIYHNFYTRSYKYLILFSSKNHGKMNFAYAISHVNELLLQMIFESKLNTNSSLII